MPPPLFSSQKGVVAVLPPTVVAIVMLILVSIQSSLPLSQHVVVAFSSSIISIPVVRPSPKNTVSLVFASSQKQDDDGSIIENIKDGDGGNENETAVMFDEQQYETERLAQDALAMTAMQTLAQEQLNNVGTTAHELRSPWKWQLRMKIWNYMEQQDIARFPRPVHHRIPNFVDAEIAAENIRHLPEYQAAHIVKVNPDTPQRPVRQLVLEDGKTLLTPQPRLRTGFFSTISMATLPATVAIAHCTNSKGVVKFGTPVTLNANYTVDLVVVGSTGVCPRTGARVGKGEGFAELEWGILSAQHNIDPARCVVVTTVHDCQVVDDIDEMPTNWTLTKHDVPVDIIVTPTRIIRIPPHTRAAKPMGGIFWDLLSPQKLASIRVLQQLKDQIEQSSGSPLPTGPDELLPPIATRNTTNNKTNKNKNQNKPNNTRSSNKNKTNNRSDNTNKSRGNHNRRKNRGKTGESSNTTTKSNSGGSTKLSDE